MATRLGTLKEIELVGELEHRELVAAPPTKLKTLNLNALGVTRTSGTQMSDAWYVVARAPQGIVGFKGSNEPVTAAVREKIRTGELR